MTTPNSSLEHNPDGRRWGGAIRSAAWRSRRRAFTLIEVLTVISIIGFLAALGVGLSGVAHRKANEASIVAQRDKLVTAIESYRADLNQYPPDAFTNATYTPAINQLYYELAGTISSNKGYAYRTPDRETLMSVGEIQAAFGVGGFLNSAEVPAQPRVYLRDLKSSQRAPVMLNGATNTELLRAPVDWPVKLATTAPLAGRLAPTAPASQLRINPWRYVSSHPTNNPTSFDLWAVFVVGKDTNKVIGNWKD